MSSAGAEAPQPGNASSRSLARRLGGLLAGLLVVAFLVWGALDGFERISRYDWRLEPGWLLAGVVALAIFYAASGAGYVAIVELLAGRRVRRQALLSVWARSLLGRYVPGNVLMVLGRVVLGREAGIPGRVSLAASVYEQALTLAAAAVASLAFLAFYGDAGQGSWLWLVALVPLGLVLLHPRLFRRLSSAALSRAGREPLDAFLSSRQMSVLLGWYGVTTVLLAGGVWALVRSAAGPEAGSAAFVGLAFVLSFVVAMIAFVFPSGLGVREGVFALALAQNLPGAVAVGVSAGLRLTLTAIELAFIGGVLAVRRLARGSGPGPGDASGSRLSAKRSSRHAQMNKPTETRLPSSRKGST